MPDGSPYKALMYGPLVLASETGTENLTGIVADDSRFGHIAHGPLRSLHEMPMMLSEGGDWTGRFERVSNTHLEFETDGLIYPAEDEEKLSLIPFYRVHDARYIVYWPTAESEQEAERILAERQRMEEENRALEASTLDQFTPGQQQPETERNFQGEETETGIHLNRHWRHATGWFSYELNDPEGEAEVLRLTYYGEDSDRHFDIEFNGEHLAEVELDGSEGDRFYTVDYQIPDSLTEDRAEPFHTVRFVAHEGSIAGGIYGVRLMR